MCEAVSATEVLNLTTSMTKRHTNTIWVHTDTHIKTLLGENMPALWQVHRGTHVITLHPLYPKLDVTIAGSRADGQLDGWNECKLQKSTQPNKGHKQTH